MNTNFKNLSLKSKLLLIIVATSVVALMLQSLSFMAYEAINFKRRIVEDLSIITNVIANNSKAALVFQEKSDAQEVLSAFNEKRNVVFATLYLADKRPFATYARKDFLDRYEPPPLPREEEHEFSGYYLNIYKAIYLDNDIVGYITVKSDLREVYNMFLKELTVLLIILLLASAVAFVISTRLRVLILKPILHLVETARTVSEKEDYTVRAKKTGQDELGVLVDAVNEMLDQIQLRDTELVKLNLELEKRVIERTAELQEVNRELEAFSYSVSHDLRAPLRGINGFSQALVEEESKKLSETGLDYLKRIQRASMRMSNLIDALLKLSRLTRSELNKAKVNLSQIVEEAAAELRMQNPSRRVALKIEPDILVEGDPRMLRIAVENLLSNAWKFTLRAENATIEFGQKKNLDETIYFFKDNGVGFDMTYANKLFGAFQRLHTESEFEGTGIGLATTMRIIRRHGGKLWAEAEVNGGATFYFTLL